MPIVAEKLPRRPFKVLDRAQKDAQYAAQIRGLAAIGDTESAHYSADEILLEIIGRYKYTETIQAFNDLDKWYA